MKIFRLLSLAVLLPFSLNAQSGQGNLPAIALNKGLLNFKGDVIDTKLSQPLMAKSAWMFDVQLWQMKGFALSASFLTGTLAADNRATGVNFRSSLFMQGLNVRYDFISKKNSDQVLIPYITAGIEYISFRGKTDMKDSNGRTYYFWNDGTIRTLDQSATNAATAQEIGRDYTYETYLRDINPDGTGNYKESALGFPVGIGVRFKLSERCGINFSSTYHFTNTDYLDGVTASGTGNRKGNSRNDQFVYTAIGFRYDFSAPSSSGSSGRKLAIDVTNVNFDAITNEDADGDGIPDIKDDSSGTPLHNKVDEKGKPLDMDDDGIPDYRDQELTSARNAVVNEDGVTITEAMIEEKLRKDSLAALPAVIEYLHAYDKLTERKPEVAKEWEAQARQESTGKAKMTIPDTYKPLDTDQNGIISPKEISVAIDEYINKRSKYTVQQFFDLIDFFFQQH